jgi:hypothetical protein
MMHLNKQEAERFYTIWFQLLYYVNQHRQLVPEFPREWHNSRVAPEVALPLRDALWEDDSLREKFIEENPANLAQADLYLVESWQHRVMGDFFIYRYLKSHTVFLNSDNPPRAYGVLGITSSFEEMLGDYIPVYVKAVLIPFENRIISDGLLTGYPIMFGSGYTSDLDDTYRHIQEREGVITSLSPNAQKVKKALVQKGNKKVLQAFQKDLGESGLSPKKIEEHTQLIEDFSQAYLSIQNPPEFLLDIQVNTIQKYEKTQDKPINRVSFKRFARFLRDTGRINYEDAEDILRYLK